MKMIGSSFLKKVAFGLFILLMASSAGQYNCFADCPAGSEEACKCFNDCRASFLEARGKCPGPNQECLQRVKDSCKDRDNCYAPPGECYRERDLCVIKVFEPYEDCNKKCAQDEKGRKAKR